MFVFEALLVKFGSDQCHLIPRWSLWITRSIDDAHIMAGAANTKHLHVLLLTLISLIYLNFQPLEVVPRCRDPQLQVAENYS